MRLSEQPALSPTPTERSLALTLGLDETGLDLVVRYREKLLLPISELAPQTVRRGCQCVVCQLRRIIDRARGRVTTEDTR